MPFLFTFWRGPEDLLSRNSLKKKLLTCYTFLFFLNSIGLGEDGPTHQPIETLEQLRSLPNLILIRPADGNEVTTNTNREQEDNIIIYILHILLHADV